jgi:undecaprenyl phosphate-alpha-L-ara4N flippase subunit ArnE
MNIFRSLSKNKIGIGLMIFSAVIVAVAQLLWKISENSNIILLLVGLVLYAMASILMVIAFRYGSLSVLHPIFSLNYGIGIALGYFFLSEPISQNKLLGVIIIMVGVALIGFGDA